VAFIAHYSHPSTVQALVNQDLTLYTMKNLNTPYDIGGELLNVGYIVNRPLQAQLLKIFLEAAMIAIDNQLLLMTHQNKDHSPRILYLTYHQSFSIPTTKTLTGQLLKRLGKMDISIKYSDDVDNQSEWTIHIDKEHILNLDPDGIIISAESPKALEKELSRDIVFKQILSEKPNCIAFLDEAIQNTPTQYIILAYFDIVQALKRFQ
jgi:iron complex transport system substrate-binding protein